MTQKLKYKPSDKEPMDHMLDICIRHVLEMAEKFRAQDPTKCNEWDERCIRSVSQYIDGQKIPKGEPITVYYKLREQHQSENKK